MALLIASSHAMLAATPSKSSTKHNVDVDGMDKSVNPGDDFFKYANGAWLKATPIPADRSNYGVDTIIEETVNKRTEELIRNAAKSTDREGLKVGAYYAAFMNEEAIEQKGLKPLKADLAAISAIADRMALARFLGHQLRADVDPLNATHFYTDRVFGLWVSPDFINPDHNVPYLLQGGLGLPDRDYYLHTGPKDLQLQAKYRAHIEAVLKLAHIANAASKTASIYAFEHKIAEAHGSRTDSEDVHKANNPWLEAEFAKRAPGLDWATYFEAAGLSGQSTVVIWQPSGIIGISALAGSEPLSVWKEYLEFRTIDHYASLLPKAFWNERFRFYGTTLSGTTKQRARWKRAIDATNAALGDAVGKMYVAHYFSAEAKAAAQEMVKNIVAAFGRRIDHLDWMSPDTRTKAKAKLETLYVGVGYPEHWRDYSGLFIKKTDPLGNAQRSSLFDYQASLARLGKPVDKTEWAMEPQTVNAVNLPLQNALNFPAAILSPPFFDVAADPVQNYGAIGAIIGHEISHSFDDQGSQFDAAGRLLNWWTADDFAHFSAASERLVKQFDEYEPLPGMHINGKLTLSENIADVAGLSASFDGYRRAYGDNQAPAIGAFTGDQRFFIAFAQAWRDKERPESLRNSLMTDGHAPPEYRGDTVRNLDAWYDAFDVKPGRKLYLAPDARVRVW
jgi:predicted metalloendopeptidase